MNKSSHNASTIVTTIVLVLVVVMFWLAFSRNEAANPVIIDNTPTAEPTPEIIPITPCYEIGKCP